MDITTVIQVSKITVIKGAIKIDNASLTNTSDSELPITAMDAVTAINSALLLCTK